MDERNIALELVRITETAALASAKFMGRGDKNGADGAAVEGMRKAFEYINIRGEVVIGEGELCDDVWVHHLPCLSGCQDAAALRHGPYEMRSCCRRSHGSTRRTTASTGYGRCGMRCCGRAGRPAGTRSPV